MKLFLPALATCALLLTTACQIVPEARPDPTRFYMLTASAPDDLDLRKLSGVTLGLHEIRLPVYLADSRALAVRSPGNRIAYRDYERWAEPLDEGIERVLRIALIASPDVARVLTLPFPVGVDRDYDLQVTMLACEGYADGDTREIRLALDYSLLTPDGGLITHGIYRSPHHVWDGSSSDLARLLSQTIADSADDILAALSTATE
jgi:uncharacterized lipoprotein YmbA